MLVWLLTLALSTLLQYLDEQPQRASPERAGLVAAARGDAERELVDPEVP